MSSDEGFLERDLSRRKFAEYGASSLAAGGVLWNGLVRLGNQQMFEDIQELLNAEVPEEILLNTHIDFSEPQINWPGGTDFQYEKGLWFNEDFQSPQTYFSGSQVGDCDDFAIGAASVLDNLGYDAAVVVGTIDPGIIEKLPPVFNHAAVEVKTEKERYFIDTADFSRLYPVETVDKWYKGEPSYAITSDEITRYGDEWP